jgi:hypothetical protein
MEERRWLHDKYERLGEEEGQLAGSRTSYFAAIAAVLVTGLVVATSNLLSSPLILALVATFLSGFGILIATVWAVLLHRTTDAQSLWREAALRLEERNPPIEVPVLAPITLSSSAQITVDLARPYHVHLERFSPKNPISGLDRVNPSRLSGVMPLTLIVVWSSVLVVVWTWFFLLR